MDSQKNSQRIIYMDTLRVICSFFVIILHCNSDFFIRSKIYGSYSWWFSDIINSFVRSGVPIFFMISGYLCLNSSKDENIFIFVKKRISKIILPFIFYSWLYYSGLGIGEKVVISIKDFLERFFQNNIIYHLWFVYMIILMYLVAPILKKAVKNCSKNEAIYFFIIIIMPTTIIPFINKSFNIWIGFFTPLFEGYLGYFLLGYILAKYDITSLTRRWIYAGGVIGIIISVLGTYFLSSNLYIDDFYNGGYQINNYLVSSAIFVFAKYNFKEIKSNLIKNVILKMSALSYGVYLIHVMIIERILSITNFGFFSPVLYICVLSVLCFVISYVVIFVLSKIKYVNRLFL